MTDRKLSKAVTGVTKWFEENPDRRICRTEYGRVRKGHIKEDIENYQKLKFSE